MRLFYLLHDLLLILLLAALAWWAAQHLLLPTAVQTTATDISPVVTVTTTTTAPLGSPLPDVQPTPNDNDSIAEFVGPRQPRVRVAPTWGLPPIALIPDTSLRDFWDSLPFVRHKPKPPPRLRPVAPPHVAKLVKSVYAQSEVTRSYNPSYVQLAYPGGDVDISTGVCTDVVVRSFRAQGVDLQKVVHEDMRRNFRQYPHKWGLRSPDPNIDHRRVPNLMTYFERHGKALPISDNSNDYQAGDVVAWALNDTQQHIGVVMKSRSDDGLRPLIGHNINEGAKIQDVLFAWPIIGHYRYFEPKMAENLRKE